MRRQRLVYLLDIHKAENQVKTNQFSHRLNLRTFSDTDYGSYNYSRNNLVGTVDKFAAGGVLVVYGWTTCLKSGSEHTFSLG